MLIHLCKILLLKQIATHVITPEKVGNLTNNI